MTRKDVDDLWDNLDNDGSVNTTDLLSYDHYRSIAVSKLEPEQKHTLRTRAEAEDLDQPTLRRIIREMVDANEGVTRPDFHLMTSNHWVINEEGRQDGRFA